MVSEVDFNNLTPVHHEYNSDQQGDVNFVKAADGLEFHVKFVNNKLVDGDHYRCDLYLVDGSDYIMAAAKIKKGLNARGVGGVEEKTIDGKIPLTPEQMANVKKIVVDFGQFDGVDDTEWWKKVLETAAKYYFGDAVAPV